MTRVKGDFNFSANFEVKKKGVIDARQSVDTYAELLEFTADNYIDYGFPVTCKGLDDESKFGTWYCIDPNDLSNPNSWTKDPTFLQVIQKANVSKGPFLEDQAGIVLNPKGGIYGEEYDYASGTKVTGIFSIVLPVEYSNTIITIEGSIKRLGPDELIKFEVGGYWSGGYSSYNWWSINTARWTRTKTDLDSLRVRFGYTLADDGITKLATIYIGELTTDWGVVTSFFIDKVYVNNTILTEGFGKDWKLEVIDTEAIVSNLETTFVTPLGVVDYTDKIISGGKITISEDGTTASVERTYGNINNVTYNAVQEDPPFTIPTATEDLRIDRITLTTSNTLNYIQGTTTGDNAVAEPVPENELYIGDIFVKLGAVEPTPPNLDAFIKKSDLVGSPNTLVRYLPDGNLGSSKIYDDGTKVGIGDKVLSNLDKLERVINLLGTDAVMRIGRFTDDAFAAAPAMELISYNLAGTLKRFHWDYFVNGDNSFNIRNRLNGGGGGLLVLSMDENGNTAFIGTVKGSDAVDPDHFVTKAQLDASLPDLSGFVDIDSNQSIFGFKDFQANLRTGQLQVKNGSILQVLRANDTGGTSDSIYLPATSGTLARVEDLATKASDSDVVHKGGVITESITGAKLFTSGIFIKKSPSPLSEPGYGNISITATNRWLFKQDPDSGLPDFNIIGPSNTQLYTLPDASGTFALKSDIVIPFELGMACSDEVTNLTSGTAKVTFRVPTAFSLTNIYAGLTTAATGSTVVVNIKKNGTTIFTTKLSIDASSKTSVGATTPYVLTTNPTTFVIDDEVTIDIDQVGAVTAGKGLKIFFKGTRT